MIFSMVGCLFTCNDVNGIEAMAFHMHVLSSHARSLKHVSFTVGSLHHAKGMVNVNFLIFVTHTCWEYYFICTSI